MQSVFAYPVQTTSGTSSAYYIPTSKAADYTVVTSGYFTVDTTQLPTAARKSYASTAQAQANPQPFWQILVTTFSELHEEKYSLHSTIADSVSIFACGAKPIAVSISGYVLFTPRDDHLYTLLKNYVENFRARHLSARDKHLTFISQDTELSLIIESISMGYSTEFETYVPVTISGMAYEYKMTNSTEALLKTYYGSRGEPVEESTATPPATKIVPKTAPQAVAKTARAVNITATPKTPFTGKTFP